MSLKSPLALASPNDIASFPRELHLNILTFLRATDLSALQRTARCFNNRDLVGAVVDHYARVVYPGDLTEGFDTPIVSGEVRSVQAVVAKKGDRSRKNSNNNNNKGSSAATTAATSTSAPDAENEKVYTYEMLRNMEMLVVARVLSRPEPPLHERDTCFYVSKSWCRAALRWLEVQEEERKELEERRLLHNLRAAEEARLAAQSTTTAAAVKTPGKNKGRHNHNRKSPHHPGSSGKKKLSRKEQRQRDRRMSDAMPPWSNINNDIVCEHGSVKQCSTKSARARRRVMDKQAWKVLKRLYPDSTQLETSVGLSSNGGCLLCAAEAETAKKLILDKEEEERANRKKPLACPLVRGFYTRGSKGYPSNRLVPPKAVGATSPFATMALQQGTHCPLKPGVYCVLPRSWCHRWRKYIKTGEGGIPPAPDASELLCDAHNLPLVPPHLESFLRGETSTLLGGSANSAAMSSSNGANGEGSAASMPAAVAIGAPSRISGSASRTIADAETLQALRAAGLTESELHVQRLAMSGMEEDMRRASIHDIHQVRTNESVTAAHGGGPQQDRTITNEQLDRENRVVVEVLTDEEVSALEKWWPRCHGGTYSLRFAIADRGGAGETEILWNTVPCRECDPSSRSTGDFVVRNRLQKKSGYR
mmetsp:Transcript_8268/g.20327  ORF Transcript_8268/g.20327 Transcript_8268/m.20327 type:complete len:648 (-) Transcript_8268:463-2406(-)|eukprot:CAMPEP_0181109646 /NCGR_PEP_ID=MMETSP1071-20121207/18289_1 /TAXON_ID=35127 /ORGANISM="Thalassiosira sp., Strain NH16" /LENGTH=647 /DNA_ID=CAMNT_0023193359 /DNA_START=507 /DNA_END=2450 /DNA_ORIENTATION=+